MKTIDFFRAILPSDGYYFSVTRGLSRKTGKLVHYHESANCVEDLAIEVAEQDHKGKDVWFALASYKEPYYTDAEGKTRWRTKENVAKVKSTWLDLDCGPGKPHADQAAALKALAGFIKKYQLHKPTFINSSGNGVHAYWAFDYELTLAQWNKQAAVFDALTKDYGLGADIVTTNAACILRPAGTHNRKGTPKPVQILRHGATVPVAAWLQRLLALKKELALVPSRTSDGTEGKTSPNDDLAIAYPPSDANKVAQHCAVIGHMRDSKGADQSEPVWTACLGVLHHTTQGIEVCRDWSSGHPGYSQQACDDKVAQREKQPTTCDWFRSLEGAAEHCRTCAREVYSPIFLGRDGPTGEIKPPEIATPATETLPEIPEEMREDFRWTSAGIKQQIFDREGVSKGWVVISSLLLVIDYIYYDDVSQQFMARIRVRSKPFTWQQGDIDLGTIAQGGSALVREIGARIGVIGRYGGKGLTDYMQTWADLLRCKTELHQMRANMGWQPDGGFLLGPSVYKDDGSVEPAVATRSLMPYLEAHRPAGSRDRQVELLDYLYNRQDRTEHQFILSASLGSSLLTLLHGAPLGIPVAAYSARSGGGKSTAAFAGIGLWGDPHGNAQSVSGDRATEHAFYLMAGQRRNLPVLLDESTDMSGAKLGRLAYNYSSGKPKLQGKAEGGLRDSSHLAWNNVLLVTSNRSLVGMMSAEVGNSVPQIARVFEVEFPERDLDPLDARVVEELWKHYGHIGSEFIRYVAAHQNEVRSLLNEAQDMIKTTCKLTSAGRYWAMLAASAYVAFIIAKRLKLWKFSMSTFHAYVLTAVRSQVGYVDEADVPVVDHLSTMLSELHGGLIVTTRQGSKAEPTGYAPGYGPPRGVVTGRIVLDDENELKETGRHNAYLYIPTSTAKAWSAKKGIDYKTFRKALIDNKFTTTHAVRYYLGSGTSVPTAQTYCLRILINHVKDQLVAVDVDTPQESANVA